MNRRRVLLSLLCGTVYGVVLRVLIAISESSSWGSNSPVLGAVSIAFLFLGPVAVGYLTVRMHPAPSWPFRLFAPWLAILLGVVVIALTAYEGWACIVMGLPFLLPISTLGGLLGALPALRGRSPMPVVAFALLPVVVGPLEQRVPQPADLRTVASVIEIAAPPSRVWQEVVQVPAIAPSEIPDALYLRMGFPRPISATIDGYGVGAMRRATFAGNLVFHETVTDWREPSLLSFRIAAQTDSIPPTTLDRHIVIGGAYFDVLQGTYELVPLASGGTRLRLTSRLRVSTHLNAYAGPWADAIMRSIQETILAVEKKRAET